MKLLLVEESSLLGDGLRAALGKAGFAVTCVRYGKAAIGLLKENEFAAVLMNSSIADMRGLDLLRTLRSNDNTLPILVLGASAATHDKVVSLESGADDYVLKSVAMEELVARLRALVRRSGRTSKALIVGNIRLDMDNHLVTLDGRAIAVSNREFIALRTLLEGVGRVLTRGQLETSLYGWGRKVESNAVEVHIHNLRQKLGAATIKTVRGVGYTVASPGACNA
jgi:two-component system response regulator QseB